MTLQIQFEQPPGTPATIRQFPQGSELRIRGGVSWGGLPVAAPKMTLTVQRTSGDPFEPIYMVTTGGFTGNYQFDIICPFADARADVTVTAKYYTVPPFTTTERETIPISFGDIDPGPIPGPISWEKVLLWSGIAIGAGLVIYAGLKLVQTRKPQELVLLQPPKK